MAKSKEKKKKDYNEKYKKGQFFTSEKLVSFIMDKFNFSFDNKTVLEPSCGDCVFIKEVDKYNGVNVDAYDIDSKLIKKNSKLYPFINFINSDFLTAKISKNYDLVIGNPPFNLKTKANYYDTTEGFILRSMELLKDSGDMILVLPSTVLRNRPYEKLRKTIIEKYKIVGIINSSNYDFLGADIETIVLHLKKEKVTSQIYKYIDGDETRIIDWNYNKRYTIHTDTTDIAEKITEKLSTKTLSDLFEIHRGKGGSSATLKGRNINFYGTYLEGNGDNYYIGIQNVAYRLTANVIKGNENEIADTITLLVPKQKVSLEDMFYYSEYLNSSIANYLLHTRVLNNCRLTIHMDRYFIEDFNLPFIKNKDEIINNVIDNEYRIDFAYKRNTLFEEILIDNNDLLANINNYWSFPKYKEKNKYLNPLVGA